MTGAMKFVIGALVAIIVVAALGAFLSGCAAVKCLTYSQYCN